MLYLIATPIGNLKDITLRALDTLRTVDYILCEDTRTSRVLLAYYEITTPLKSYHKFNEKQNLDRIIQDLKSGKQIALISDAGTPAICDPGAELAARCHAEKLPICVLPGPSALTAALCLSGSSFKRFQFIGFLPKGENELKCLIAQIMHYPGLTLCYETPHRISKTLKLFPQKTPISIARELTKIHEEFLQANASDLIEHFAEKPARGEMVLLVEGKQYDYMNLTPQEHVTILKKEYNISTQEAIKLAAHLRDVPKSILYRNVLIEQQ